MKTAVQIITLLILFRGSFTGEADCKVESSQEDFGKMFIAAINSDSEQKRKEIISAIYTDASLIDPGIERLLRMFNRLSEDSGHLTFHHSETPKFIKTQGNPYIMHVYAKKDSAALWKDLQLWLDPSEPHKIISLAFIAEVAEPIRLPDDSIEHETVERLPKRGEKVNKKVQLI